jgi:DNA polymerase I
MDPDFQTVSKSQSFWQDVIDAYYSKYKDLYKTHMRYIQQVNKTGSLISPLGREYQFKRYNKKGNLEYSEYEITNYPNQGLGADVCAIARISLANRLNRNGMRSRLISTIHDSLTTDSPPDEVDDVQEIILDVFKDLPKNISKCYGVDWNIPLLGEIGIGPNLKDLQEV